VWPRRHVMACLFLSYAVADREFAERLAVGLTHLGHTVWFDTWEIAAGEVLTTRIDAGLARSEYLIVVLSPAALSSPWVERELGVALYDEIVEQRQRVLPVIVADCRPPPLLRAKRTIDFRESFEVGLAQLAIALYAGHHVRSQDGYGNTSDVVTEFHSPLSSATSNGYTHRMGYKVPRLSEINVELTLPYIGKIAGVWKPDEAERRAAWELYVELVTRVSAVGLQPGEGLLRESLTSLYAIFTTTRALLRSYGPSIAQTNSEGNLSFGIVAVNMLNYVLRPILAKWHPVLLDYEHQRDAKLSAWEHEKRWDKAEELRTTLQEARNILTTYTNLLAQVAGVPELIGVI
jgi:hypothetical protein